MSRFLARLIPVVAIAVLTACSNSTTQSSALPYAYAPNAAASDHVAIPSFLVGHHFYHACPPVGPGFSRCFAILSDAVGPDSTGPGCPAHTPGCYGPSDLQAAYGITAAAKTGGKGVTVAIVDAHGYPTAAKDLAAYRKYYGLPACGTGCLTIVNQSGKTSPLPSADAGWDGEQALDLDMVSATCPNCKILLVQSDDASNVNLYTAVATASKMAHVVSNSWGGGESAATYPIFDSHKGVVILASAGDSGAGAPAYGGYPASPSQEPCGFAGTICVGGTSLTMSAGKRVGEVVWDGLSGMYMCGASGATPCATGSGCSALVKKPTFETDHGCTKRSSADISANADPYTGVAVSCTPCGGFLSGDGGTSESSPLIAGMYGLAGNAATQPGDASVIWKTGATKPTAFHDITSGHNDLKGVTGLVCSKTIFYICNAGKGYDGPTGWGTPNGLTAL